MCNKYLSLIRLFMYCLGWWLVQRSGESAFLNGAESTERAQPDWSRLTYTKMPDAVVDQLRDLITAGKATQATAWLWMVIARRVNRRSNRVEMTVVELIRATGLSRETVLKHTAVLETAGLVTVNRSSISRVKNGINVYHLDGEALAALLSPVIDSRSTDSGSESNGRTPGVYSLDRKTTQEPTQKQTQKKPAAVEIQSTHPGENLSEPVEAPPLPDDTLNHENPAVEQLVALGVEHYKARELSGRYDPARIEAVADHCQRESIRNKAAFAVKALNAGWSWDKKSTPQPRQDEDGLRYLSGEYGRLIRQDMGISDEEYTVMVAEAQARPVAARLLPVEDGSYLEVT